MAKQSQNTLTNNNDGIELEDIEKNANLGNSCY